MKSLKNRTLTPSYGIWLDANNEIEWRFSRKIFTESEVNDALSFWLGLHLGSSEPTPEWWEKGVHKDGWSK